MAPDTFFGIRRTASTPRAKSVREQGNFGADGTFLSDILALNSRALRSLSWLFDEKEQLFSERLTIDKGGYRRDRVSRKHTAIALLGLHRLADSGETQPFDIEAIEDVVFQDHSWVESVEDLGLLTWLAAVGVPGRLEEVLGEFSFETALTTYDDGRRGHTAALAWLLMGIAHTALAQPARVPELTDVAVDAYRLIQGNQNHSGIFGHAALARFPKKTIWGRFGTFHDQSLAIYALSTFAQAFQIEEPLESALACANSICALQGDFGQWWSLYDKRSGSVASRYPIVSAQQDGIAPCALLALGEATGRSFQQPILKGLSWITGANEIGVDLRSQDGDLIWDSIEIERRIARYWDAALGVANIASHKKASRLKVRYEARPDHFGWLLYACGKLGTPNARKLAAHA